MFRTLIYPSSVVYDYSVELPHWSCVLGSMCVGVFAMNSISRILRIVKLTLKIVCLLDRASL